MPHGIVNGARDWIIANALMIALVFAGLIAAIAAVQTVRLDGLQMRLPLIGAIGPQGWINRARSAEIAAQAEKGAHQQTKDNYRQAQADAARQQADWILRREREMERINDEQAADHRRNLDTVRARYERLLAQRQAGAGAASAAGAVPMPGLSSAASGIDGAARDHRLSAARSDQLERDWVATRQAIQLDALISWVAAQAAAAEVWQGDGGK